MLCCNLFFAEFNELKWIKINHIVEIISLILILVNSKSRVDLFSGMLILFLFIFMSPKPIKIMSQQRNFYGIKQVFAKDGAHVLMSQSTLHGFQVKSDLKQADGARGYYGPVLPVVRALQASYTPLRTLILGLGTGMMVCQFSKQDQVSVVEIDEQVIKIANDPLYLPF